LDVNNLLSENNNLLFSFFLIHLSLRDHRGEKSFQLQRRGQGLLRRAGTRCWAGRYRMDFSPADPLLMASRDRMALMPSQL
jgi:hypothetical protein